MFAAKGKKLSSMAAQWPRFCNTYCSDRYVWPEANPTAPPGRRRNRRDAVIIRVCPVASASSSAARLIKHAAAALANAE